jgi:hypothetical protein
MIVRRIITELLLIVKVDSFSFVVVIVVVGKWKIFCCCDSCDWGVDQFFYFLPQEPPVENGDEQHPDQDKMKRSNER